MRAINKVRLGIVGIVAVVGAGFGVRYMLREHFLAPFNERIGEYTSALKIGADTPATPGAGIKGNAIVIDQRANKCDHLYFDLPPELQAASPEAVQTVVWVDWTEHEYCKYTNGATGYIYVANVSVIDKTGPTLVGKQTFQGGTPPSSTKNHGSVYGSKPTDQIVSFVQALRK
ncbi:MAG TPA: hypothetical protein VFF73_26450 [Planctomycetota bacterium]|nr:hypothetical protein [Planctomycetota bacterium]